MDKFSFYVPADPVRQHVLRLRDFGIGHRQLAKVAKVSPVVIMTLLNGHPAYPGRPTTRITYGAATRLLRIEPEHRHLADGAMIGSRGSQRRIQALCSVGYSLRWQADTIGTKFANYQRILKQDKITKSMAERIDELYKTYAFEHQQSNETHGKKAITITKNHAKRKGWVAGAAWDDIDKDKLPYGKSNNRHPSIQTRLVEVVTGTPTVFSPDERTIAINYLKLQGWTFTQIAKTLHMAPATVSRLYHAEDNKWNPASTEQSSPSTETTSPSQIDGYDELD